MTADRQVLLKEFNEAIDSASVFNFCTRDSALQQGACGELEALLRKLAVEKQHAIDENEESFANIFLGCECVASALIAQLQMWMLLKKGCPDDAWNELVNAQGCIAAAMRADAGFSHLASHVDRLDSIEHTVFPPQVFLSAGMIVERQVCSICCGDYEDCDHIKGRPYIGRFCTVQLTASEMDHIAIVDLPANKHSRTISFTTEDGVRNRMTWTVEPYKKGQSAPTEGLTATSVIATAATFEEGLIHTNRSNS